MQSGKEIITLEGINPDEQLNTLQKAFMETGAIQCGYCTPAQLLAAKALLDKNPNPTEAEIRKALNTVVCRCTGYVRPVQAIQRAAAQMRGEKLPPADVIRMDLTDDLG